MFLSDCCDYCASTSRANTSLRNRVYVNDNHNKQNHLNDNIKCNGNYGPHISLVKSLSRVRENLHLDSVSTNYGKKTVRNKASKIWNKLPSSLKEFFSVKHFSSKLKEFLPVADIDSII